MKNLKEAVQNTRQKTSTENGMKTFNTSLNACADLFFRVGASRGKDLQVMSDFEKAFQENPEVAIRIMLWSRDIREGAGERQIYRSFLNYMEKFHPEYLDALIGITPEIGRWDDLLGFNSLNGKRPAFDSIKAALAAGNALCAKWMPRSVNYSKRIKMFQEQDKADKAQRLRTKQKEHNEKIVELRSYFGWTPKQYRKTLSSLTKVVESQMCSKDWDNIEFGKVPSLASARYQSAFGRNAQEAYAEYKDGLVKGTEKINAGAVYPYDVIKPVLGSIYNKQYSPEVVRSQWDALPNYIGDELILPMVDVSGSMGCEAAGNLSCMDVAISLGLYLSDKNQGDFKDMFLTFSGCPKIEVLKGDIISKIHQMRRADWGMNTNLEAAFEEVLKVAKKKSVPSEGMPKYILILSDMEFDYCVKNRSAFGMIKKQYKDSGYELPKIVFWNLNARNRENVPVKFNKEGTALVSGFSPSIMKSILKSETFTPESIMLETVNVDRYNIFG